MRIGEGDSPLKLRDRLRRGIGALKRRKVNAAPRPEEQERPKRYGIKFSDLTKDVFMDILSIYDDVAGTNRVSEYKTFPDRVDNNLSEISSAIKGGTFHRMFGSHLSPGSKLSMRSRGSVDGEKIVKIYFEVQENGEGTKEGPEMERKFRDEVENYLLEKGLAVGLEHPRNSG